MALPTRRRPIPPIGTTPPDRFVTGIEVEGLFGSSNAHITFGRNKNFLIGPNGSGKTTIVHILASCLRNDFTQLFELPFRTAAISLKSISNSTDTKIVVQQNVNAQTGRKFIQVDISGDFKHQETIEMRTASIDEPFAVWMSPDRVGRSQTRFYDRRALRNSHSLTNTTWLSIHRGEIGQLSWPGRQSSVDRHLDNISRRLAQFNSRRNSLIDIENTEFQKQMFLSFLTPRISLATLRRLGTLNVNERIQQLREILHQLGVRADEAEANLVDIRKT